MKTLRLSVVFAIGVLVVYMLLGQTVKAAVNTLTLEDSYSNGSDTICVYSNGQRTETYLKEGAGSCPSKMTFD